MSHTVCQDIGNWFNQNVQQQLEQCVEQSCNWWCLCCNKWLCALVWILVTVTVWVITRTCEVVADVIDVVVGVVTGLIDIAVGIFTLDWSRVLGGLIEIFVPIITLGIYLSTIGTLGSLVGAFSRGADRWSLRDHARTLLMTRFGDNKALFDAATAAVGTEGQGFGLRLSTAALRCSIRSDLRSRGDGPPDLIRFVDEGLDLKTLAGFGMQPPWWSRAFPEIKGDNGPISAADIDDYIARRGSGEGVKHFTLSSMSRAALQSRLDAVNVHASELGLILQWTIQDVSPTQADQFLMNDNAFASVLPQAPFSRHADITDPDLATAELCMPVAIAAFGFMTATLNGISTVKAASVCVEPSSDGSNALPPDGITGTAFRYRQPDIMFKYTLVHELGHSFGLCHVNGLFRIMFTNAPDQHKSLWSWSSLYQLWTQGPEAGFVLDEGKAAWNYIVANFGTPCLVSRPF